MAIVADDLTGAADCGLQFVRYGLQCVVALDGAFLENTDVYIADTDSRSVTPAEAYMRVQEVAHRMKRAGIQHIYKKIDSTLRGNLGAEIQAIVDVYDFQLTVVVPAFPKMGRTTERGIHYVHGVPVSETETAQDVQCPVLESDATKLLSMQLGKTVGLVDFTFIRGYDEQSNVHIMVERVMSLLSQGIHTIVFDAQTDAELEHIVNGIGVVQEAHHLSILWVGSAGLAEAIAARTIDKNKEPMHRSIDQTPGCNLASASGGPVLIVSGSRSRKTQEQLDFLRHNTQVVHVMLDLNHVEETYETVQLAIGEGQDVVLFAEPSGMNERMHAKAALIAQRLGELTARVVQAFPVGGFILTGGDTAKAVCKALGVSGLLLVEEVEPGLPMSRLIGTKSVLTVTKAGAFGSKPSLAKALSTMHRFR
jgi:uncharacterized protein YgbK (DUF1537 family)